MDNARNEEIIGQDDGQDVGRKTDSDANYVTAPATDPAPDEDMQPEVSSPAAPLAVDDAHTANDIACHADDPAGAALAGPDASDTPVVVEGAVIAAGVEVGPAEPGIQLPAVVQGGPIAPYVRPIPYNPIEAFLMQVRRNLPQRYEFNDETNMICTRLGNLGRIPLCGPLWVCRLFRTLDGLDWSREVQFLDLDGVLRNHVFAASDLIANGRGVAARLVSLGLDVPGDPAMLAQMIRSAEVRGRAEILKKPGWTTGPNPAFALPTGEVVAKRATDAATCYQYVGPTWDNTAADGTLKGWQTGLAACAIGNPALIFVISLAFLGPLLPILGIDTVGFHIYCRSSSGKSTIAAVAQSVWRQPKLQSWDATLPATEQICRTNHQTFCVLDELPAAPKINLGDAIYLIFNGSNRAISAGSKKKRPAEQWNVCLLSSGEEGTEDVLARNGGAVRAGHRVRLIDIGLARDGETIFPHLHNF